MGHLVQHFDVTTVWLCPPVVHYCMHCRYTACNNYRFNVHSMHASYTITTALHYNQLT